MSDVKAAFPFNVSQYHFRFQTKMGALKVWIDTSRDTVAVPNIDGVVKIKLLKLPQGVKPKQLAGPPTTSQSHQDPVFEKAKSDLPHYDNFSPSKHKNIPHSNSHNNLSDAHKEKRHSVHKLHSQKGHDDELIGGFDDDEVNGHHSQDNTYNDMDFNIDTDDIFGSHDNKPHHIPSEQPSKPDTLLDFETTHNVPHSQPPKKDDTFDLAGGLGDLEGFDFSAKPEETKTPEKPISLIDHVSNIHKAGEKEKEEWAEAYKKYDHKIKIWKGMPVLHSVKILLCTLHDVLWEGSSWKRMGMHELGDPNSVKKAYRRAILITHPDRVNKSPTDQKFLANRIFGALNEAWKVFEATGQ